MAKPRDTKKKSSTAKKLPRPQTPPAPKTQPSAGPGATIHIDELVALTGLGDRRLREMAHQGFFPVPEMNLYQTIPTLAGLIRFYRTSDKRETIQKAKLHLIEANLKEKNITIGKLEGTLKPLEFFASKTFALGEEIKATIYFQLTDRLPALNAGLDAVAQRKNNLEVADGIMARFQDWAKTWT